MDLDLRMETLSPEMLQNPLTGMKDAEPALEILSGCDSQKAMETKLCFLCLHAETERCPHLGKYEGGICSTYCLNGKMTLTDVFPDAEKMN
jgi:hypothetical protein